MATPGIAPDNKKHWRKEVAQEGHQRHGGEMEDEGQEEKNVTGACGDPSPRDATAMRALVRSFLAGRCV